MTGTLLAAKLAAPTPPRELVERARLYARLDAGTRGPLTLLSAPAGWGKTVLLSSWLRAGGARPRAAWLWLEPGDGAGAFWRYLHAALSSSGVPLAEPDATAGGGMAAGGEPEPARFAEALARLPAPVVLVIDDLDQLGDDRALAGVDFLLRHAAGRLRLVIAARTDPALPLHRWRLRGELTELRADELAFTVAETAELLGRHGLARPAGYAGELRARTEGWPAGARLAALSMVERGAPAWFLPRFTGDDPRVADYLRGEVLAGQPAEAREFLLGTSILGQVCGELADALTGRVDGERILDDLDRSGAFVTRLARPGWRRYHRLFGELLRAELRRQSPQRIPELHRAASDWLAAHGLPLEALRHALAAGDRGRAVGVLAEHWPDLLGHGHEDPLPVLTSTPPEDALRADPELALAYAVDLLDRRDPDGADPLLRLAEQHRRLVPAGRRGRFALVATALRAWQAQLRADPRRPERLLALLGEQPPDGAAAFALTGLGTARLAAGELDAAQAALADALARAERAGLSCPRLACASRLAFTEALRGELRAAEHTARAAIGMPSCAGLDSVHCAYAYLALAIVDIEWDRLADAEADLGNASGAADPLVSAWVALVRARLLGERGELVSGHEALRDARQEVGGWPYLEQRLAEAEADLRIRYGDTRTARELQPGGACAARAYLRDSDPDAALKALPDWAGDGVLPVPLRLDAGLTEALAARQLGEARRSRDALEGVLRLAEPDGYRRVFTRAGVRELLLDHLDSGTAYWSFAADLLSTSTEQAGPARPAGGGGEPLTDRELAVLRYLPSMLSNVEIARSLCLSVNTVKTHVRHIYRKLHATRRREAVRRARELRLI
jgi:LuxR family maltose regulon positive regulatory protein